MHARDFTKSFLTALALAAGGFTVGCVIGDGDLDDDGTGGIDGCPNGSNNHELLDTCYCDAGYTWEDPNDPDNYNCVEETAKPSEDCTQPNNIEINGQCFCDDGYDWCSPNDPNDYSCCQEIPQGDTGGDDGGTGTDTGADSTDPDETGSDTGVEPDPATCTTDNEGAGFCSNSEADGPEGSRYWVCMGGTWVEDMTAAMESCTFDMYDFAYGCIDIGTAVQFVCGNGPGTACEEGAAACVDADVINYCVYGKLTQDSCMRICTEEGDDMGVTYDYGECSSDAAECFCCDEGEEGCPAGM